MRKHFYILSMVIFSALILVACGPKIIRIDVDMQDFKFIPDAITVPTGAQVTINLTNSGALEHEMVIMVLGKQTTIPFDDDDEANIYWEAELESGKSETITFTAPTEPGDYQIVCGTAGHLEQGMKGTLTVTERP